MAKIVDSYSESNENGSRYVGSAMAIQGIAQSFTGDGGTLATAVFHMRKYGSPTGNAVAKVYSHSGTFGTSSVPNTLLATSDNFDVSTIGTSYALHTLTFSGANKITLSNGTNYVVSFEYSGGNGSDYISISNDTSSPTHAGNYSTYNGSWSAGSTTDLCFYVYRDDISSVSLSPSSSPSDQVSESLSPSLSISLSPSSSQSPSSSISLSPSVSISLTPSPSLPPTWTKGVLKISKPNINVLTNSDIDKFIFHSDYGTLKYFYKGTMSLTVLSNATDLGTDATGYYEYNLGYYPFVEVYMKTPTGFYVPIPTTLAGASTSFGGTFNLTTTRLNITATNSGYPSFSGNQTYIFIYFIFKNNLQL